jgi:hypothetical protein
VILAEANSRIFSEQLPGDARYVSPERIVHGDHTGAPKPTKAGDVYSYGCVAILVRCAVHRRSMRFHQHTLGIVRKCAVLVDPGRESSACGERQGHRAFSFERGGMTFAKFLLRRPKTHLT